MPTVLGDVLITEWVQTWRQAEHLVDGDEAAEQQTVIAFDPDERLTAVSAQSLEMFDWDLDLVDGRDGGDLRRH